MRIFLNSNYVKLQPPERERKGGRDHWITRNMKLISLCTFTIFTEDDDDVDPEKNKSVDDINYIMLLYNDHLMK